MKAVVLVGGQGTRLRPLTLSTPKQMLPVAEVPMIERVLTHLAAHGVDEAILSMGYRPDSFLAAFPDHTCAGVRLTYAVEPEPLDTGGGIAFSARSAHLHKDREAFIVVNGDVLTDLDLSALVAFHHTSGAEATIALTPVDDPSPFGVLPTDSSGRVAEWVEKPTPGTAPSNDINAGFYVVEPRLLDRIPPDKRLSIERVTFQELVTDGTLYGLSSHAYWTDTGTPELYLQANLDYLGERRGDGPPVAGAKAVDDGSWYVGGPVVDTVTKGSLVGDAAFVAGTATVVGAIVGSGARVEDGADVGNSLLLPGAVVHEGATVAASIVGQGAVVGAGATLIGLTVVQGGAVVAPGTDLDGARVSA